MSKPNILFILCDDLGINDLHCYGRSDHNTPHLDQLAQDGTRFTCSYASQAICSPSRAGILTGINPARLHLTTYLPGRPNTRSQPVLHPEIEMDIPLTTKTWPRYFKEAGYATGIIGKWHAGQSIGPEEHGFDVVHHAKANTEPSATEGGKGEFDITNKCIDFIKQHKDQPFVAYVGHHTPHIPYTARQELIDKNKEAFEPVYAALIETLDESIGLLMGTLDDLGLRDNTIVVFTSDNGGLHVPELRHERVTHNTPFRAGKGYVYEGGQRVPAIVRWPGQVPAGRVVDTPTNNIDWLPTFLQLIGADAPQGIDGVSFADGLTGNEFVQRPLFWHFPHYTNQGGRPSGAMRDGDWLLVEFYDCDKQELYNLSDDISEKSDQAAAEPERLANMRAALDQWRQEADVQYNTANPDCDAAAFQNLYVDFDPSLFDPLNADENQWERIQQWRVDMDKAVNETKLP